MAVSFFGDGSGVYSCGCLGCLPVSLGLDRIPELGDVEADWCSWFEERIVMSADGSLFDLGNDWEGMESGGEPIRCDPVISSE